MRMGTAARPGSRGGLGALNTNISVADRPVTQQGMMGMKLGAQGPGRQIADKSYYMGQLRMKCDEMQEEMNRMNQEAEQFTKVSSWICLRARFVLPVLMYDIVVHNQDTAKYSQMERKYESLIKEVRKLQGSAMSYAFTTPRPVLASAVSDSLLVSSYFARILCYACTTLCPVLTVANPY